MISLSMNNIKYIFLNSIIKDFRRIRLIYSISKNLFYNFYYPLEYIIYYIPVGNDLIYRWYNYSFCVQISKPNFH